MPTRIALLVALVLLPPSALAAQDACAGVAVPWTLEGPRLEADAPDTGFLRTGSRTLGWTCPGADSVPGGGGLTLIALIMIAAFVLGGLLLHRTRFGSQVFAVGGDARAALLMGAPVGRITIAIYAFSGFMAALAGVVFSIYTGAGYALSGVGVELEAIAAVVIGGALLTGGSGGMIGSFFGVMIQGLILTYITFEGSLTSWWAKIVIGLLILMFLVLRATGDSRWLNRLRARWPSRQAASGDRVRHS